MARSLEVYRATTFSMVTGSPSRTSSMRCWAIAAGLLHGPPLDRQGLAVLDHPGAGRLGDPDPVDVLVSAWSQTVSWPASPASTGTRWRPSSAW